jgi:3-hydroxyacyl-CoA dehydrogenase
LGNFVETFMSEHIKLQYFESVALVTVDNPPVSALSAPVRKGLREVFGRLECEAGVHAVVLICAGLFAGPDTAEFSKRGAEPDMRSLFSLIEAFPRPVVMAIHGDALGSWFELALAAHYRVAAASATVGLPQVSLGVLPGYGGTQRLPRLIGAEVALDLMTTGRSIGAEQARDMGLLDAVVPDDRLKEEALVLAEAVVRSGGARPRIRDRDEWQVTDRTNSGLFRAFRQANAARWRGFRAQEAIVQAVEASLALPFEEGMKREAELCEALIASPEAAAQRA